MDRIKLLRILQNYLGMQPQDKNCFSWKEMQEKMADEILALCLQAESAANHRADRIFIRKGTLKYRHEGPMGAFIWEGVTTGGQKARIRDTMYIEVFVNDILMYEGKPDYKFGEGQPSHEEQMIKFVNESNHVAITIE